MCRWAGDAVRVSRVLSDVLPSEGHCDAVWYFLVCCSATVRRLERRLDAWDMLYYAVFW